MYSFHLLLISSAPTRSLLFLSFIVSIFGQNVLWYFQLSWKDHESFPFCCFTLCLCSVHWRRPSCRSLLFFGILCLVGCTFPFLPCFSFLFFLQLFVKLPQITTLSSCFSFYLRWFCSLLPAQYYEPSSIVLQAHCLLDLIPLNLSIISTAFS